MPCDPREHVGTIGEDTGGKPSGLSMEDPNSRAVLKTVVSASHEQRLVVHDADDRSGAPTSPAPSNQYPPRTRAGPRVQRHWRRVGRDKGMGWDRVIRQRVRLY